MFEAAVGDRQRPTRTDFLKKKNPGNPSASTASQITPPKVSRAVRDEVGGRVDRSRPSPYPLGGQSWPPKGYGDSHFPPWEKKLQLLPPLPVRTT
jgi:hypothetical protein